MIDAHVHVWDLTVRPQPWTDAFPPLQKSFSVDDLAPELSPDDRIVVVQTVAEFGESLELLALAAVDRRIAGVVGWVDLTGDVPEQLAELRAAPGGAALVGVRHQLQIEPDAHWLARGDVRAGLYALGEAGLVFDVVVSPEMLGLVVNTVDALPGTRFVIDHGGKPPLASSADGDVSAGPLRQWATDMATLAARQTVAVKISGLVTEADWQHWTLGQLTPAIEHLVRAFGPDRVMFGSDWPVCLLAADHPKVAQTLSSVVDRLPSAAADAIWGGTARTWYGLEDL